MLKVEKATIVFHKNTVNEKAALQDLSLSLKTGDFVTVLGSNGAGKSTLFAAIAGSYLLDTGRVILDSYDVTSMQEHHRARMIGRIYQDPLKGTAPGLTIEENLSLPYQRAVGRFRLGISRKDREYFREKLRDLGLGLEDRMQTKVGLLSGGQRQAVTLLMATLVPPKLLLLDEHTAALDPGTAEKVLELTCRIVAEHRTTCMMITHNITSALELGNRTIMMDDGKVVLDLSGQARKDATLESVMQMFREKSKKHVDNDRMLLE